MTSRQTVPPAGRAASGTALIPNRTESRHPERLATRAEVAEYLGVPVTTVTTWAYKRIGPPYKLIGKHARYSWSDVDRWVNAQSSGGAA
jgi:excisionase family DNA binding protein